MKIKIRFLYDDPNIRDKPLFLTGDEGYVDGYVFACVIVGSRIVAVGLHMIEVI
jgi:hypothetical protein